MNEDFEAIRQYKANQRRAKRQVKDIPIDRIVFDDCCLMSDPCEIHKAEDEKKDKPGKAKPPKGAGVE